MNRPTRRRILTMLALAGLFAGLGVAYAQERGQTSYAPVDIKETFASIVARMKAAKPEIEKRQAWQNYIESAFNVQRRMGDWYFETAKSWDALLRVK